MEITARLATLNASLALTVPDILATVVTIQLIRLLPLQPFAKKYVETVSTTGSILVMMETQSLEMAAALLVKLKEAIVASEAQLPVQTPALKHVDRG